VTFDVEAFDVKALLWGQCLPDKGIKALRYEVVARNFDGIGDNLLDILAEVLVRACNGKGTFAVGVSIRK
jgi:hypothetical protein